MYYLERKNTLKKDYSQAQAANMTMAQISYLSFDSWKESRPPNNTDCIKENSKTIENEETSRHI